MEPRWAVLGSSRGPFGQFCLALGASGGSLWLARGPSGRSWEGMMAKSGPDPSGKAVFAENLEPRRAVLGGSRGLCGQSWAALGASGGGLGLSWKGIRAKRGPDPWDRSEKWLKPERERGPAPPKPPEARYGNLSVDIPRTGPYRSFKRSSTPLEEVLMRSFQRISTPLEEVPIRSFKRSLLGGLVVLKLAFGRDG